MTLWNVNKFKTCKVDTFYHIGFFFPYFKDFIVIIFLKRFIYLFYFWLCWVFVAACGLYLVAASEG